MATRKKTPGRKKTHAKKKSASKSAARARTISPPAPSAEVVPITRGVELSISQLAQETGHSRETIRKALNDASVNPSGLRARGNYNVYRLRAVLPVLIKLHKPDAGERDEFDPDKLSPFDRRLHYQTELDKLKLQLERGELVPSFEVERTLARLFKLLTQHLDTLPDIIERDVGATAKQLARIERLLDECREAMYREVVEDEDADSAAENRT